MPDLVPVDHDPFAVASMTHVPEQSNPAQPYLDIAKRFASGGLQQAFGLPNNFVGEALQNPDNQAAFGMAASFAPRAAQLFKSGLSYSQIAERLGATRGAIAGSLRDMRASGEIAPAAARPEAFSNSDTWDAAKILRVRGANDAEIARRLGVSPMSVSNAFRRGGGTDMTPSTPSLKFMRGQTEEISPADMKEFLKTFRFEPVDHDPFKE